MSEIDTPDGCEQLDQLSVADTLIDRGVDDPLDEGITPADRWSPAQGFGSTAAEMRQGETLEQRIAQEQPEDDPDLDPQPWNAAQEPRQVGTKRAGRLVNRAGEPGQSTADDVGIDGGAACAEEAAMHIIDDEDLRSGGYE